MGTGLLVSERSVGIIGTARCAACQAHTWTEERR